MRAKRIGDGEVLPKTKCCLHSSRTGVEVEAGMIHPCSIAPNTAIVPNTAYIGQLDVIFLQQLHVREGFLRDGAQICADRNTTIIPMRLAGEQIGIIAKTAPPTPAGVEGTPLNKKVRINPGLASSSRVIKTLFFDKRGDSSLGTPDLRQRRGCLCWRWLCGCWSCWLRSLSHAPRRADDAKLSELKSYLCVIGAEKTASDIVDTIGRPSLEIPCLICPHIVEGDCRPSRVGLVVAHIFDLIDQNRHHITRGREGDPGLPS